MKVFAVVFAVLVAAVAFVSAGGYGGGSFAGGYGGSSGVGVSSIPAPPCPKNYIFSCQPSLSPAPCAPSAVGGASSAGVFGAPAAAPSAGGYGAPAHASSAGGYGAPVHAASAGGYAASAHASSAGGYGAPAPAPGPVGAYSEYYPSYVNAPLPVAYQYHY